MPTVVGTDHRGREVSTLDLTVQDRLVLLRKVKTIHEQAENKRAGKERSEFLENSLEALKVAHMHNQDEFAYLNKIISPDIPLHQETHPEFFSWRQRGAFPTTLDGLEAQYLKALEEGAERG